MNSLPDIMVAITASPTGGPEALKLSKRPLPKIQPEEVIYYPFELELRANWDLNETFNTTQNYLDLLKNQTSSDTLKEIDGQ